MHILYLVTRAEMGGSQTHILDLLKGFRYEYELTVATGEEGFLTDQARSLGLRTVVLPHLVQPLRPLDDARALVDTFQLLRRLRPDIIHCHTSKAGIIGRMAARCAGVPAVFTAHTWSFAEGTSVLWKLVGTPSERLAANWSEKIIAVSESNRGLAIKQKIAAEAKIVTVHNGVADTIHRSRPDRRDVPRITMVARFAPQKNQSQLVEAAAAIRMPFRLQFVGDGATRPAVQELANRLGVTGKIDFLGVRSDTDQILSESEICVLATNWEGFPITILEAMRAGLPVIATDVDGVREAVIDGETGFLVPRGDTGRLTECLNLLIENPELRKRLGSAGRKRYESEFTRAVMLRKIAGVYHESVPASRQMALQNGQFKVENRST